MALTLDFPKLHLYFLLLGGCKKVAVHSREQALVPSETKESDKRYRWKTKNLRCASGLALFHRVKCHNLDD